MTTWVDVADTAIKIGLGALLAGGFSIFRDIGISKRDTEKFLLHEEYQVIKDVLEKLSLFHDQFRKCSVSQETNWEKKFEPLWESISDISSVITKLLYLDLLESKEKLISYHSSCEAYIGTVQKHMLDTGGDKYQNRLEPIYGSVVSMYEELVKNISKEFHAKKRL